MNKVITSRDNALFKRLKKISESARERRKLGQTLLDGTHLLQAYVEVFGPPQLLVTAEGKQSPEVDAAVRDLAAVDAVALAPALFAELSPVATPTGILALVEMPHLAPPQPCRFGLLLEDIQDPGNMGSLLRSAAAAGVEQVWLSAGCTDAWSPKALRGGQGAHFVLPMAERADLPAVAAAFPGQTLATCLSGESIYHVDLSGPVAFIIGNEGAGLSQALLEAASRRVTIPMPGQVESLNAGAAAAICLFERVRQHTAGQ